MKKLFIPLASVVTAVMMTGTAYAQVVAIDPALQTAPSAPQISYEAQMKIQKIRDLVTASVSHGLIASMYLNPVVELDLQTVASLNNMIGLDAKLTAIVNRLASDLSRGRVLPTTVKGKASFKKDKTYTFKLVADNYLNGNMSPYEFLYTVAPKNRIYVEAQAVVQRLLDLKNQGLWSPRPANLALATVKLGVKNAALIAYARRQLNNFGYPTNLSSTVYDAELKAAIMAFQADNGLGVDGVAGTQVTWKYLDKNVDQLLSQAIINLDRTRWLPAQNASEYIFINIARQKFQYMQNEVEVLGFKTVNGRLDRPTPIMVDSATQVVLNPTWTVPSNIFVKDKIKALRENPSYITNSHMKLYYEDTTTEVDPLTVDWTLEPSQLPYTIVQDPGPWNALGFIKFPLQNGFAIYMHDTDARGLFNETDRLKSSGCIRLEKPFDVAEKLLASPQWTVDSLRAATELAPVLATKPTYIGLKRSVPVYIFYQTISYSAGKLLAGNDPYEVDKMMYSLLMTGK